MKTILQYILILISSLSFGQISVTTISPEIKGSGGLSLDTDGNLYIADFGDFLSVTDSDGLPNDVLKMDSDFNITQYSTGFVGASGNDFDSNGILFQSDIRASAIYKIVGGVRTFVTNTGMSAPVGLVFDSNDNFYVCNCGDDTIRKVDPSNNSTLFASGTIFSCPNGITVDENDNLYVTNFNNGNIIKITPSGVATLLNTTPGGTTGGPSNGHLDYHEPTRTLFIASHGSNKIYYLKIDDPTNLQILAGSGTRGNSDGTAATASFSRPNGVAVTQTGDSIFINSAVPVTNIPNGPLNPQLIRLITGVQSVLSVDETQNQNFNVKAYPNPFETYFVVEAEFENDIENFKVIIYSPEGRILKTIKKENNNKPFKIKIDLSDIPSGIYFYSVESNKKVLFNGNVIKK